MGPTGSDPNRPRARRPPFVVLSERLTPRAKRWLVLGLVGIPLLGTGGCVALVLGAVAWSGADARAFVHRHFEAARHRQATAPSAASAEMRDAYRAVAASTDEKLPMFSGNHSFGTPYYDMDSETCLDAELVTRGSRRPVSVIVRSHTKDGTETFEVHDMSLVRRCDCPDKRGGQSRLWHCQLE